MHIHHALIATLSLLVLIFPSRYRHFTTRRHLPLPRHDLLSIDVPRSYDTEVYLARARQLMDGYERACDQNDEREKYQ